MNWPRTILDGTAMALFFNAAVLLGFLYMPQAYTVMFPKEIKEAAAPYVDKAEVKKMKIFVYSLYLILLIYWAISAHFAGISGFWHLFWTGYAEMTVISISDFLILDCWLPPKAKPYVKGAENCRAWEVKEWLIKLAIPEHGLFWTFIMCPIAGLIVAGIASLLG